MSKALEDRISALETENLRLVKQNRQMSEDFDKLRAYFAEKPATLDALSALDRACRQANGAILRDRQCAIDLLGQIGFTSADAESPESPLTDCGVNPLRVVCTFANGGSCLYPSNADGCRHGREHRLALTHGVHDIACMGNSAYAFSG